MITRLELWWSELADKSCTQDVPTFYGPQPMHQLLERSTWHSARSTRGSSPLSGGYGIEPKRRITPLELAGLPLPERVVLNSRARSREAAFEMRRSF